MAPNSANSSQDRTPPTILVVQHGLDDPPSRLGGWLGRGGCSIRVVRCYLGEQPPGSLRGYDGLVVLGGAMGAYDDEEFPWLTPTKSLLAEAAEQDLPTLGICLGHQLLAVANGGRVETASVPQLGLTAVSTTVAAGRDALFGSLPTGAAAVHWNNDVVVAAPAGAVRLSESESERGRGQLVSCRRETSTQDAPVIQAMRLGSKVWGVQFHPEVDVETVSAWADDDVRHGRLTAAEAGDHLSRVRAGDADVAATWAAFTSRFARVVRHG